MKKRLFCFAGFVCLLFSGLALATPPANPAWWTDTTNGTAILNGNTANNYAPANLGQLKYVASQAKKYLDNTLSNVGGAGPIINNIVSNFSTNATINYAPVTTGQLKYVAQSYYDRLVQVGFDPKPGLNLYIYGNATLTTWTNNYPWPVPPPAPGQSGYNSGNYSTWQQIQFQPVNLGQLKLAFSFNLPTNFTATTGNVSDSTSGVSGGTFLGEFNTTSNGNYSVSNPGGDPDFSISDNAASNYVVNYIGTGQMVDTNNAEDTLIEQTTTQTVGWGNYTYVVTYPATFQFWDGGLYTIAGGQVDSDDLYNPYESNYLWSRVANDGTVLGGMNYQLEDFAYPAYWRPGMSEPATLDSGQFYTFCNNEDIFVGFFGDTLYADTLGNIYTEAAEEGGIDWIIEWNIYSNQLTLLGSADDPGGNVTIPLAYTADGLHELNATVNLDYGNASLAIDGVTVPNASNVSADSATLIGYARTFTEWSGDPIIVSNDTVSLLHSGNFSNVTFTDSSNSTTLLITGVSSAGYAVTNTGNIWANGTASSYTSGTSGNLFVDQISLDGNMAVGHLGDTSGTDTDSELVLLTPIDPAESTAFPEVTMSANEFSGATRRKIALNGRPLADGKPQTSPETDHQPEETFIDALTQGLRHNVTDFYAPVAGTDMPYNVTRVYGEEIWTPNEKLQPWQQPEPFGAGWRSNLAANIRLETFGDTAVVNAYVTDEDGDQYKFLGAIPTGFSVMQYVPYPSSTHEKSTYTATLMVDTGNNTLIFTKKFGTQVTFDYASNVYMNDTITGDDTSTWGNYEFYRADNVKDILGNQLRYGYGNSTALLPSNLTMYNHDGTAIPGANLTINYWPAAGNYSNNSLVENITDSDNNTTTYNYANFTDSGNNTLWSLANVTTVTGGVSANVTYTYYLTPENDHTPHTADYDGFVPIYDHLNLSEITDQNGHSYQFAYRLHYNPDWTQGFMNYSNEFGYYPEPGRGLLVSQVTLPDGSNTTLAADLLVKVQGGDGYYTLTGDSERSLGVTDADGRVINYSWSGAQVVQEDVPPAVQSSTSDPCCILYQAMRVDYGSDYGYETYFFNPQAGMALQSTTDLSGAMTNYAYNDLWTAPTWYSLILPNVTDLFGFYDDPTMQHDAAGGVKTFSYTPFSYTAVAFNGTYRMMSDIVDQNGYLTHYTFNTSGLRLTEAHYSGNTTSATKVAETDFTYGNTSFPGVVTSKNVVSLSGDPGWSGNMVANYTLNSSGRIETKSVVLNGTTMNTTYTYSNTGDLLSTLDPLSHNTTFTYDSRHRLTETTYPDSTTKSYTYDARGNQLSETDELGHSTTMSYDALNRVTSTTRILAGNIGNVTTGITSNFTYNHTGARLSVTDPNGGNTTYAYDDLNRLTSMTTPEVSVNGGGNETLTTTYAYSGNCGGAAYDSSGFKPTSITDPRGFVTNITYDGLVRPLTKSVEYSAAPYYANITNTYDAVGNLLSMEDDVQTTDYTYDSLNRLVTTTHVADGTTVTEAYTSAGLPYLKTDELGRETETEYDLAGRAVEVISPDPAHGNITGNSSTVSTIYDKAGNPTTVTNPLGANTTYTYDTRNRRLTETEPDVADWNNSGASTAPVITTTYDDAGNVLEVENPVGGNTVMAYDAANRPVWVFTPKLGSYWNGTAVVTANYYLATEKTYDANSNVLEVQEGTATGQASADATITRNVTINTYDALNRLLSTEDAANITVSYQYDAAGNRSKVTDGLSHSTAMAYDGLNRVLTVTDPLSHNITYTYGPTHVESMEYANGNEFSYSYDGRDRKTSDGTYYYNYDYAGQLVDVAQPNGYYYYGDYGPYGNFSEPLTTTYAYDGLGRVLKENQGGVFSTYTTNPGDDINPATYGTLPGNFSGGITDTFSYDKAGNRLSVVYDTGVSGNRTLNSTYDALNRIANITDVATGGNRTTTYHYDLAGRRLELLQPIISGNSSGNVWTTYDGLGRQATITGNRAVGNTTTTPYKYTLTFDQHNNLAEQVEAYTGTGDVGNRTVELAYDNDNRLTLETLVLTGNTFTTAYTYDNANNRSTRLLKRGTTVTANFTYSYDNADELSDYIEHTGSITTNLTYDNAGNRLTLHNSSSNITYGYDAQNRLASITETSSGNLDYNYAYDYLGRRLGRGSYNETTGANVSVVDLFDGDSPVRGYTHNLTWGVPTSNSTAEYIRGSDMGGGIGGILYSLHSNTPTFYQYDGRGDVATQTNGTGGITYQAAYDAFGSHGAGGTVWGIEQTGTNSDPFQYSTQEQDPSGLTNFLHRVYDPATGTWLTRDPAGMIDGPNEYTDVMQNPWTKFDPEGLAVATTVDPRTFEEGEEGAGGESLVVFLMANPEAVLVLPLAILGGDTPQNHTPPAMTPTAPPASAPSMTPPPPQQTITPPITTPPVKNTDENVGQTSLPQATSTGNNSPAIDAPISTAPQSILPTQGQQATILQSVINGDTNVVDIPGKPLFKGVPGSTVRGPNQSRTYGDDGYPKTDRDSPHPGDKPPGDGDHSHDWSRPDGGGPPEGPEGKNNPYRGDHRAPQLGDPPIPSGQNTSSSSS